MVLLIIQWFNDSNVTQIDEKRFNQEHCDDTCFKNYAMPGKLLLRDIVLLLHAVLVSRS